MTTVHLSEAEARRAGLIAPISKRTRTAEPRAKAEGRCCTCDERFTGETTERRHNQQTGHARFEMVLQ